MADLSETPTIDFEFPLIPDSLQAPQPFSSLVKIDFSAVTDPGKKRTNNEDAYLYCSQGRFWEKLATSLNRAALPAKHTEIGYVMAVADGMGGAAAGEVASGMALTLAVNLMLNAPNWGMKLDNPEFREEQLNKAKLRAQELFRRIDAALLEQGQTYPSLKGMGTTLTAARSVGDDLFTLHVGDSRAYLYRGKKLIRLTQDQTVAQRLADTGEIEQHQVSSHWLRHTLTSVMGGENGQLELEIRHARLMDGDRVLLCTDGLSDVVTDEQISETMSRTEASADICRALLDLALNAGAPDNVTILCAHYSMPR